MANLHLFRVLNVDINYLKPKIYLPYVRVLLSLLVAMVVPFDMLAIKRSDAVVQKCQHLFVVLPKQRGMHQTVQMSGIVSISSPQKSGSKGILSPSSFSHLGLQGPGSPSPQVEGISQVLPGPAFSISHTPVFPRLSLLSPPLCSPPRLPFLPSMMVL